MFIRGINMTRREEIELAWLSRAVQSNHRYDEKSFKEAVEWADKTWIQRLENWLNDNFGTSYVIDCYGCLTDKTEVTSSFDTIEELMESFHKIIEE